MSSIPPHFNFAVKAVGIESLAGAVVFVVLYMFLLAFFIRKSFTHPIFVHYVLTVFCTIRVIAFVIRAFLAGSTSAGETLGLVVVDQVLFRAGYFSLLLSAYSLVLDRILLSDLPPRNHPFLIIAQNRRLFHIALLAATVLEIFASANTNSDGTNNSLTTTKALHIASVVTFLILTIIQAILTILLSSSSGPRRHHIRDFLGFQFAYGNWISMMISLLLFIREAFAMVTVMIAKQDNERLWYPFLAVTEILIVMLYITPELVPRKDELSSYSSVAGDIVGS